MKVFVEFLKSYGINIKGDTTSLDSELFKELELKGIVQKKNIYAKELKEESNDFVFDDFLFMNIKGEKYKKNKIDIVVLTQNKEDIKTVFGKEKMINSYNVIESDFIKTGKGFAENCNIGAGINSKLGEFILFLNDDVVINDINFFLSDIIKPFKDEKVGLVGSKCSEVPFGINGSVMCIRRELFERFGGFDENFFFMWEDNDICKNIRQRGYEIIISEAKAEHEGNKSIDSESEFWRENYYLGKNYYETKWRNDKRIIGSLIIGDENDRYLTEIVTNLFKRNLIDHLDVVFDKSNKETVAEIMELKKYYSISTHYHDFKLFGLAENLLRQRAVNYAMCHNPYAIIPIDADEILDEELNRDIIYQLLESQIAIDFYIAHFWGNKKEVRIDGVFGRQKNVRLFKVLWNCGTKFYEKGLHCGSAPIYAYSKRHLSEYYFRHYGYVRKEDIEKKRLRQMEFDKNKMLENHELYDKMDDFDSAEVMKFNKYKFIEQWKK